MRIESVRLQNFKRFTDLTIDGIQPTARLVVIVGPNGCGKSSVFDALIHWHRFNTQRGHISDAGYYRKSNEIGFDWNSQVTVKTVGDERPQNGSFYFRSAYRNDPDFNITGINKLPIPSDVIRISRSIETDQAVSDNYQRLVYDTISGVYNSDNDAKTVHALREELIGSVQRSMQTVFGDLQLRSIQDPLGGGTFFFRKGQVESFNYKNLSGGEKSAFDLILDAHIKKTHFQGCVFCIDEIETHLHTMVQGRLLVELSKIFGDEGQLWVTTHSLGVIRAAQEMHKNSPGSVNLIDFSGVDADEVQTILPSSLDRVSWEKLLSIALDDLSERMTPKYVIVCEGSTQGNRRKDFDAEILNRILGSRNSDIMFVSGGSSNQVAATGSSISGTLKQIMPSAQVVPLCDRDDKSQVEVDNFERDGGLVLDERNIESYIYADDVIAALLTKSGQLDKLDVASKIKSDALANSLSRGNPSDDIKSASGEIFTELVKLLQLTRAGNNKDAFMRDTLAPLISPGMATYDALRKSIVERLPTRSPG